jgi:threonine synthase
MKRDDIKARRPDIWRYREFLPVINQQNIVSLGEGFTPVLKVDKIGRRYGTQNLYLKNEGFNPTGTFKDRGAAVGVSKAKELGVKTLAMATAGNAGAAWAAYAAAAGLKAYIAMPSDAPPITIQESLAAGADVSLVEGLISDIPVPV